MKTIWHYNMQEGEEKIHYNTLESGIVLFHWYEKYKCYPVEMLSFTPHGAMVYVNGEKEPRYMSRNDIETDLSYQSIRENTINESL